MRIPVKQTVVKPALSAIVMAVIVWGAYKLFMMAGHNSIAMLGAIVVGACVYGIMVIKTKAITRDEVIAIKFGTKIARIGDKLRLW